ncbi:MAG: pyridoxamine 5'-phosphate oxidase family protein [Emergencia sp.]|nr:pyridoxamine 5'-phosphate oxidase family protein [Emergencia sp.]
MFRNMRRSEKATDIAKAEELLRSENYGVLSVIGDEGYPYGVPVNYVYDSGRIFFHSTSASSHKIEAIRKNEKVSFTVVTEHDMISEKLDTMYTSVIVFGRARILSTPEETREAVRMFLAGLAPEQAGNTEKICQAQEGRFIMVEITTEHISGKIGR